MIKLKLNDPWEVGETKLFGGEFSVLPDGMDATDFTIKFLIKRDGTLLDTISAAFDENGEYIVNHKLDDLVTEGKVDVLVYIVWTDLTERHNFVGQFNIQIKPNNYS